MDKKELLSHIFSRKSSIAAVGITALFVIALVQPGQLSLDENSIISMVPMPKVPAAEQPVDWKIPAEITVITCLAIIVQGLLDYLRPRKRKIVDGDQSIESQV